MKFFEASNLYSLNKSTYVNLRWIAYSGQLIAIFVVQFLFHFEFNYLPCIGILLLSILTNLYLQIQIRGNQINNFISTTYLSFDIFQLGILFFFTGGITNPFIFLIIVPVVFSSQHLNIKSNIIQVIFVIFTLFIFRYITVRTFIFFYWRNNQSIYFFNFDTSCIFLSVFTFFKLNYISYFHNCSFSLFNLFFLRTTSPW